MPDHLWAWTVGWKHLHVWRSQHAGYQQHGMAGSQATSHVIDLMLYETYRDCASPCIFYLLPGYSTFKPKELTSLQH